MPELLLPPPPAPALDTLGRWRPEDELFMLFMTLMLWLLGMLLGILLFMLAPGITGGMLLLLLFIRISCVETPSPALPPVPVLVGAAPVVPDATDDPVAVAPMLTPTDPVVDGVFVDVALLVGVVDVFALVGVGAVGVVVAAVAAVGAAAAALAPLSKAVVATIGFGAMLVDDTFTDGVDVTGDAVVACV